jgi:hypothetical protein
VLTTGTGMEVPAASNSASTTWVGLKVSGRQFPVDRRLWLHGKLVNKERVE